MQLLSLPRAGRKLRLFSTSSWTAGVDLVAHSASVNSATLCCAATEFLCDALCCHEKPGCCNVLLCNLAAAPLPLLPLLSLCTNGLHRSATEPCAFIRHPCLSPRCQSSPYRCRLRHSPGASLPGFAPKSFDYILVDAPCSALGLRPRLLQTATLNYLHQASALHMRVPKRCAQRQDYCSLLQASCGDGHYHYLLCYSP